MEFPFVNYFEHSTSCHERVCCSEFEMFPNKIGRYCNETNRVESTRNRIFTGRGDSKFRSRLSIPMREGRERERERAVSYRNAKRAYATAPMSAVSRCNCKLGYANYKVRSPTTYRWCEEFPLLPPSPRGREWNSRDSNLASERKPFCSRGKNSVQSIVTSAADARSKRELVVRGTEVTQSSPKNCTPVSITARDHSPRPMFPYSRDS